MHLDLSIHFAMIVLTHVHAVAELVNIMITDLRHWRLHREVVLRDLSVCVLQTQWAHQVQVVPLVIALIHFIASGLEVNHELVLHRTVAVDRQDWVLVVQRQLGVGHRLVDDDVAEVDAVSGSSVADAALGGWIELE